MTLFCFSSTFWFTNATTSSVRASISLPLRKASSFDIPSNLPAWPFLQTSCAALRIRRTRCRLA
eukprot:CAMPEP_0197720930 /NCGR_PEP_ID=MMETSP1434-20131217/4148_1 /TAXON_ID=265543 /ORGANISM="Minutocellus polymorphus, Strain CCMP3303" /LENGTH=63 /DNA_ID=CAMNT_0043305863 /DNA_START=20 /DNA_END=208 /DNA_ORIENTATION=+